MSKVKTIFLSHTELEAVSQFWDLYVKRNSEAEAEAEDEQLQRRMDAVLASVSDETRDTFLSALDQFELQGEEFQVRIAPDDSNLVRA